MKLSRGTEWDICRHLSCEVALHWSRRRIAEVLGRLVSNVAAARNLVRFGRVTGLRTQMSSGDWWGR